MKLYLLYGMVALLLSRSYLPTESTWDAVQSLFWGVIGIVAFLLALFGKD